MIWEPILFEYLPYTRLMWKFEASSAHIHIYCKWTLEFLLLWLVNKTSTCIDWGCTCPRTRLRTSVFPYILTPVLILGLLVLTWDFLDLTRDPFWLGLVFMLTCIPMEHDLGLDLGLSCLPIKLRLTFRDVGFVSLDLWLCVGRTCFDLGLDSGFVCIDMGLDFELGLLVGLHCHDLRLKPRACWLRLETWQQRFEAYLQPVTLSHLCSHCVLITFIIVYSSLKYCRL